MPKKKEIICLICCRGGSKTIKNKNIKLFNKKPLLYWSLKNLIKSKVFTKIVLSTDSKKIAKIASLFKNVEIPGLRPKKLAKSDSNQFETHQYIFRKLKIEDNNSIVCVFNNNPFITAEKIKESFQIFKKNKFKGLVRCCFSRRRLYSGSSVKNREKLNYIFKRKFFNLKLNRQTLKNFMLIFLI